MQQGAALHSNTNTLRLLNDPNDNITFTVTNPATGVVAIQPVLGAATATKADLQSGALVRAISTDATDSYSAGLVPKLTSLTDMMSVEFRATTSNTGVACLNIDTLGCKAIVRHDGSSLQDMDIVSGRPYHLTYIAANDHFRLPASIAGGATTGGTITLEDGAGVPLATRSTLQVLNGSYVTCALSDTGSKLTQQCDADTTKLTDRTQANTWGMGARQSMRASTTTAGLGLVPSSLPNAPAAGDLAADAAASNALTYYDGSSWRRVAAATTTLSNGAPLVGAGTNLIGVGTTTGTGAFVLSQSPTLANPVITSFVNSLHDHTSPSSGGQIGLAGIAASGTPSINTFLRGDGTWASVLGDGTTSGFGGPVEPVEYTFDKLESGTNNTAFLTIGTGASLVPSGSGIIKATSLVDGNGNNILLTLPSTNPVNQLAIKNAAAGAPPELQTNGSDANIDLRLTPKGNGSVSVPSTTNAAAPGLKFGSNGGFNGNTNDISFAIAGSHQATVSQVNGATFRGPSTASDTGFGLHLAIGFGSSNSARRWWTLTSPGAMNVLKVAGPSTAKSSIMTSRLLDDSGGYGAELVTNSSFDTDAAGWTLGTNWSREATCAYGGISASCARFTGGTGTLSQAVATSIGRSYLVTFKAAAVGTFNVTVSLGGASAIVGVPNGFGASAGVVLTAVNADGGLVISGVAGQTIRIAGLSVKEVLGSLQINPDTSFDGRIVQYRSLQTFGNGISSVHASVSQEGRGAPTPTTTLCDTAACPVGLYRVSLYLVVTGPASASSVQGTIGWHDGTGLRTRATNTVDASAPNYIADTYLVRTNGTTPITYTVGLTGSPTYAVHATVERMQ